MCVVVPHKLYTGGPEVSGNVQEMGATCQFQVRAGISVNANAVFKYPLWFPTSMRHVCMYICTHVHM